MTGGLQSAFRLAGRRAAPSALVGVLGAFLLVAGCTDNKDAALHQPGGEDLAPELVATDLAGDVVRLADLRGKVVLVNFWQASCGPCLGELPGFDAFYRANQDKGAVIVAVNMGESDEVIEATARRMGLSLPLLVDRLDITSARYNVLAVPTSFLIDADGKLVERINGPLNEQDLAKKFGPLLGHSKLET
ncbi:TlpA family protein disulfide reductase [Consotaella aegiceratis]|uniref:TlpA family protein disulfide reductase n=1 Tax=Consotaella aegiceratis TaxID=3097961 RepID=UPI002F42D99A